VHALRYSVSFNAWQFNLILLYTRTHARTHACTHAYTHTLAVPLYFAIEISRKG